LDAIGNLVFQARTLVNFTLYLMSSVVVCKLSRGRKVSRLTRYFLKLLLHVLYWMEKMSATFLLDVIG